MTVLEDIARGRAKRAELDQQMRQARTDLALATEELEAARGSEDERRVTAATHRVADQEEVLADLQEQQREIDKDLTSRRSTFLKPARDPLTLADRRYPLLMLPVRLEARYAWRDPSNRARRLFTRPSGTAVPLLLVRVYPDDVHINDHDPAITPQEEDLQAYYRKRVARATDLQHFVDAWAEVIGHVGPQRAAWLMHSARNRKFPRASDRWGAAPVAALLPDRWVAVCDVGGQRVHALSGLVREPLPLAPSPTVGRRELAWLTNFDEALSAGMAIEVPLPATGGLPPPIDQLIVVGAHASRSVEDSTLAFEALLDAHHYTRGLAFLTPGSPTNSVGGERPDHTSRPSARQVFAVEGDMVPLTPATTLLDDREADGHTTAQLLGISASIFEHVAGADEKRLHAARDIRQLLAAAAAGTLRYLLGDTVSTSDIEETRHFLIGAVEGLGPLPALRIGDQPYGILPVADSTEEHFPTDPNEDVPDPFRNRLAGLLMNVRHQIFEPARQHVPYVGKPSVDATETLLSILRSDGVTHGLNVRTALGPHVTNLNSTGLTGPEKGKLAAGRQAAADILANLGFSGDPPLVDLLFDTEAAPVRVPFVQATPPIYGQSPTDYLYALSFPAGSSGHALLELVLGYGAWTDAKRPRTLLFALARLGLLSAADEASRFVLRNEGLATDDDLAAWDLEAAYGPWGSVLNFGLSERLQTHVPSRGNALLGGLLTTSTPPTGSDWFVRVREAIRHLAYPPSSLAFGSGIHDPDLLEVVLRSELSLLSHRLDAWFTALSTERLKRLRSTPGYERGFSVAGWGVLFDIRPNLPGMPVAAADLPAGEPSAFVDGSNAGYVHAPTSAHAATAAVMRSAHLAQWRAAASPAAQEAFSIDMSSARVRVALSLLDGVRQGQPVGALLGYHIERHLRDAQVPEAIAVSRRAAPLVAQRLTPGGPVEAVAANTVVDGLALLTLGGHGSAGTFSIGTLTPKLDLTGVPVNRQPAVTAAIEKAAASAHDALDALSDLLLAEGVFQLVQGNPQRSAGVTDVMAAAGNPPPEPEVVRSNRTGVAVTHRIVVGLPAEGAEPSDDESGWAVTPRSELAPILERWARSVLPEPADIELSFGPKAGAAATLSTSLADLQKAVHDEAIPNLRVAALDIVAESAPASRNTTLARLIAMARFLDDDVRVLTPPTSGTKDPLAALLEAADSMRDLLNESRSVVPSDLGADGAISLITNDAVTRLESVSADMTALSTSLSGLLTTARSRSAATATAQLQADIDGLVQELLAAAEYGIDHAFPLDHFLGSNDVVAEHAGLIRTTQRVVTALTDRIAAHDSLAQTASGDAGRVAYLAARGRALFGSEGWVTSTTLGVPNASNVQPLEQSSPSNISADACDEVFSGLALVRPGAARLDRVISAVETLQSKDLAFVVSQQPLETAEGWVALPPPKGARIPGGRTSVLAHLPFPAEPGPVAALLVDDWVEVVPESTETTSIAFHYDAPSSSAPNTWLLALPGVGMEQWTIERVTSMVEEALALSRLRAVDPDALSAAGTSGPLLPLLFSRESATPGVAADAGVLDLTAPDS